MQGKKSVYMLSGVLWAVTFGLFLLSGTLSGSDFPRGIVAPPKLPQLYANNMCYDSVAILGANYVSNAGGTWEAYSLATYRDCLATWDLEAHLAKSSASPFLVHRYSRAQYMKYEMDLDSSEQVGDWNTDGTGYYFFEQSEGKDTTGMPTGGTSWFLDTSEDDAGEVITGPKYTYGPIYSGVPNKLFYEWWRNIPYTLDEKVYKHRISVATDLDGVHADTTIFALYIDHVNWQGQSILTPQTIIKTASDFNNQSEEFLEFSVYDTIESTQTFATYWYRLYWPDNSDVWVDYIESMDTDAAEPLIDNATVTFNSIYSQCDSVETIFGNTLAYWLQAGTPRRNMFTAHGMVSDSMRTWGFRPAVSHFAPEYKCSTRRFDHYLKVGRPAIMNFYRYVFRDTVDFAEQCELDTLTDLFTRCHQVCADTLDWHFLCQAHRHEGECNRGPVRSEILVQAYMALAHGAKGISYYKYTSTGTHDQGLVHPNTFAHCDTPYVDKWNAVQEVFTVIDSIGGTLLELDRDTAFCVYHTPNGFLSPITNAYFEDDDDDYIEVGQFDSSGTDFLILVNRRTNYDRHITVETDLTGTNALRDIYNQEHFISSTGDFYGIPFDSGEGRVFRIEEFSDRMWQSTDKYVLADTVTIPSTSHLYVYPDCHVKATSEGFLKILGNLTSNGGSTSKIKYTPIEGTSGWEGIGIYSGGEPPELAFLNYCEITDADYGLLINGRDHNWITNSLIEDCGTGYKGIDANTKLEYSDITDCITGLFLDNCDDSLYYLDVDSCDYYAIFMSGGTGVPKIGHCNFINSYYEGIWNAGPDPIMLYHTTNHPRCGWNVITGNNRYETGGSYTNHGGLYNTSGSPLLGNSSYYGNNSIYGNSQNPWDTRYEHHIQTDVDIDAEYNYWGDNDPYPYSPSYHNFSGEGNVDFTPWLEEDPNEGGSAGNLPGLAERARKAKTRLHPLDAAVERADNLYLTKNYTAAIEAFLEVIERSRDADRALHALRHMKDCYTEMRDLDGLIATLKEVAKQKKRDELSHHATYYLIDAYAVNGQVHEALALANNPEITSAWPPKLQEMAFFRTGMLTKYYLDRYYAGQKIFKRFLKKYPDNPLAVMAMLELGIDPKAKIAGRLDEAVTASLLPEEFALHQNFPNPFNASTTIRYDLPELADVTMKVYNIMGREVARLVDRKEAAGYKRVNWSGLNRYGGELSSGVYILQMIARGESGERYVRAQKMLLIK